MWPPVFARGVATMTINVMPHVPPKHKCSTCTTVPDYRKYLHSGYFEHGKFVCGYCAQGKVGPEQKIKSINLRPKPIAMPEDELDDIEDELEDDDGEYYDEDDA